MTDPLAELAHGQAVAAARAERAASELSRDDAKHLRRLVADQAALLTTLVTRTEANGAMLRDLVDAALTADVRQVVAELHKHRSRVQEQAAELVAYQAMLRDYRELYGVLPEEGISGDGGS